jgi:cardiolipin synthase
VDGIVGFIGGAGVADIWLGNADSPAHWRDTHFRLQGPAVGQMQAAFMDNWMKTTSNVLDGRDYFPELPPVGSDFAQVIKSSPREGTESVRLMYLISIAAARQSIRLSMPYFVAGPLTTQQLRDARMRGVTVEVILPGARSDTPIVRHASRSKWGPLLEAGVRIYEYQPTMYHCKMMIVDDVWVSVGSANFDSRSFRLNDESNLNVLSRDFAAEQVRLFEHDKQQSREVTYRDWRQRSIGKRLMEFLTAPFHSHL